MEHAVGGSGGTAGPASSVPMGKRLGPPIVGGVVFIALFFWIVGVAMHSPKPHDAPLGLVGDPAMVQQTQQQLEAAAPGAFDFKTYADPAEAEQALKDTEVIGAFAPGPDGATLYVATGYGLITKAQMTTIFTEATAQAGVQLKVQDVSPTPNGDALSLVAFFALASLSIGGVAAQVLLYLLARGVALRHWLGAAVGFSVLAGLTLALFADFVLDAFYGNFWEVAGISALYTLVVVTVMRAFQTIGMPGIPLGILTILPLGIATSGGTIQEYFLPDFYRQLHPIMPSGSLVSSLRGIGYLDNANVGSGILVMSIWIAAALLIVVGASLVQGRRTGTGAAAPDSEHRAAHANA